MRYTMTTQREIRRAFWGSHPELPHRRRRTFGQTIDYDWPTNTRVAFVDFVDALARNGEISEALAARVTL